MWDQRYSNNGYAYGTEPNDFLASMLDKLPAGKVLCLAEGEGRDAVWLAQRGREVTAADASGIGLEKALRLADARGVKIMVVHADLAVFEIEPLQWDDIVSIFCHLPPELRRAVQRSCVESLRPQRTRRVRIPATARMRARSARRRITPRSGCCRAGIGRKAITVSLSRTC